jgi:glycosyltransferase involved in cell wall biosynthesis
MTDPAFSICIPNYNYANYIGDTIQSVLNQTYPHYEIVVVDNASTDNSVEVIESFRSEKIRLFQNQYNVGFAPNLDRVASRAKNPYLIMLSSDDLMRPTALEEYARVIKNLGEHAERSLVFSEIDVIDSQGRATDKVERQRFFTQAPDPELSKRFPFSEADIFCGLSVFRETLPCSSVPGPFCSTMYSRKLYEQVSGYSSMNHIGPDAHFVYKVLLLNGPVVFVNKNLFAYRIHDTNQLSQDRRKVTIKLPIDRYLFTLQYSDQELASAGLKREHLIEVFINKICIRAGISELRRGSTYQAFRFFMFGFASYPGTMLLNWRTYPFSMLLMCGPIGSVFARLGYRLYAKFLASEVNQPKWKNLKPETRPLSEPPRMFAK